MRSILISAVSVTAAFFFLGCGAAAPNDPAPAEVVVETGNGGTIAVDGGVAVVEGPAGRAGAAGTAGTMGAAGAAGTAGSMGAAGVAGPQGPAGPEGPPGPNTGVPGPQGPVGAQGPVGTGAMGFQGSQGATGAAGVAGPPGAAGPAGPSGTLLKASMYLVSSATVAIGSGNRGQAMASCSAAKDILITGGCNSNLLLNINMSSPQPMLAADQVSEIPYWDCWATNPAASTDMLWAYAVCLKVP